ncbi:MAG: Mut7-C RNAse domain-containing protein [Acidimicrobiia bacterium]
MSEAERSAVTLRFYAELNDFLTDPGPTVTVDVKGGERVGDLIAACGVRLEQVDLIVVDGRSIDFDDGVSPGDRIGVYPVFEAFDIEPAVRVRPRPLRVTRFLVDSGLEALAALLIERGFDAEARRHRSLSAMVETAAASRRIILTREPAVLASEQVSHGYLVRATDPDKQLAEVLGRLQLSASP